MKEKTYLNTNNRNNRIEWIDVCKGILILLMVWGHIPNISQGHNIDITYMSRFLVLMPYYVCWFMQAFFILTGFTTNFNIGGGVFVKKQIKSIIIPWFSFSIISRVFYVLYLDEGLFYNIDGLNYFFLIEDYWFLSALFFSKITFFFLQKTIKSDYLIGLVLIGLMTAGYFSIIMFKNVPNPYHYYNYLHIKDFLCMVLFLWVGVLLKRYYVYHDIFFKVSVVLFGGMYVFRYLFTLFGVNNFIPTPVVISHYANIHSILQLPVYIFYVITGSFTMFYLVQKIKSLFILAYIGRNSLVIYCAHFVLLCVFIDLMYLMITPDGLFTSFLFLFSVLFFTLLSLVLIIKLLNYRPFSFLLGKF